MELRIKTRQMLIAEVRAHFSVIVNPVIHLLSVGVEFVDLTKRVQVSV